jgi:plastocyanin
MLRWPLSAVLPLLIVPACSDDAKQSVGLVDAGPASKGDAAPSSSGSSSGSSGAPLPPLRCTDAELAANDKTDGGALTLVFTTGAEPVQYSNRCSTVKVGATVVFSGSFKNHPLEPAGGDRPSPIPHVTADAPGMRLEVPMTTAGTFGFECEFHPELMFGAIRVVP